MDKCLIFGNNYFAELMCEYIEEYTDIFVEAFLVNREYILETKQQGKDVIPYEELEEHFDFNKYNILVTSGYRGMNRLRRKVCNEILEKGYHLQTFIHPDSHIYTDEIGPGNIILEQAILGKHVKIGVGNIIWNGVNISHHSYIGDYNFLAPSCTIGGRITMKDNCFCGLNSTIKGGVNVESYTLVGAGAFLNHSSKEYEVYVHGIHGRLDGKNSMEMLK